MQELLELQSARRDYIVAEHCTSVDYHIALGIQPFIDLINRKFVALS